MPPPSHARLTPRACVRVASARAAGISDLLGLRGKLGETADGRRLKGVWHRIRALLSSLGLVLAAEARGLDSVLIVEGDVRPVPSNQLPVAAVGELRARLSHEPWSVVRLGGHFWKFSQYRKRRDVPSTCPAECTCARPARPTAFSPRFCTVRSPVAPDASGDDEWMARPFCTVKDSVAFAVHSSAYPAFRRARERAFAALQQAVNLSRLEAAAHGGAIKPVNETFGLSPRRFELDLPWFDVWLPARLDNTHVLPSLTVQQIRQGDEQLSRSFAERCSPGALPAAEARARKGGKRGAQRKYLHRNETRRMVRGRGYRPAQGQVQSPGALRDV